MTPNIRIHVLPGGEMPKRQTEGAIGYDVALRAVVSATEMCTKNTLLRRTLFNFEERPEDPTVNRHVIETEEGLVYRMDPHESVLVGLGFVTEMPFPMFYWVTPRSGLASKHGITVTNAPGTIDPDYRGEAGVLVFNRNDHPFDLRHNMRIAQIVFQWAVIPEMEVVDRHEDLGATSRGTGGFGSTGIYAPNGSGRPATPATKT